MADDMPVVVFDLDGTVLSVNSFPRWVLFLIAGRVPELGLRRRLLLSLKCQWLLLCRKLSRMNHDELLCRLQYAWGAAGPAATTARFEAALLRRVRSNLVPVLELVMAERMDAVLATAAAADYAEALGRQLGFRHVLATARGRSLGEPGNTGAQKRERVLAYLEQHGWSGRPIVLFTDHIDDLPLMRDSSVVCWFGAPETLAEAAEGARTRLIYCRDLDGEAACGILRSLCLRRSSRLQETAAS